MISILTKSRYEAAFVNASWRNCRPKQSWYKKARQNLCSCRNIKTEFEILGFSLIVKYYAIDGANVAIEMKMS